MTRAQVVAEIESCEKLGVFDKHIDPIPEELIIPVDENYHYINQRTSAEKIKYLLEKIFCVFPFTWYENKFVLKTKYVGKENFKGLNAAVLTCNHVTKFDCLAVKYGAKWRRTFVVAAHFNNMKGFLGEMMRAGDMVPLNTVMRGKINFSRTVEDIIKRRRNFLLIYPEEAMWWNYRKPRPYKSGAFNIAVKYNVPVVPQFITFRDLDKLDKDGFKKQQFTVHIAKPIYPKENLSKAENTEYLATEAFNACKKIYEETYGIPLTYSCNEEKEICNE